MSKTVTLTMNECVDIQHLVRIETTATKTAKTNRLGDPITKMDLQAKIDRLTNIDNVFSNTEPDVFSHAGPDLKTLEHGVGAQIVEAYEGYYEDTLEDEDNPSGWVAEKIRGDSREERLRIYCHWNGILGYHELLFAIATDDFG